ncbi:hypothetical protein JL722_10230 [Aureococcus anophagefferens]|nr:hypothetical protein JL722_10230 [Aureococcus anophagefferens]
MAASDGELSEEEPAKNVTASKSSSEDGARADGACPRRSGSTSRRARPRTCRSSSGPCGSSRRSTGPTARRRRAGPATAVAAAALTLAAAAAGDAPAPWEDERLDPESRAILGEMGRSGRLGRDEIDDGAMHSLANLPESDRRGVVRHLDSVPRHKIKNISAWLSRLRRRQARAALSSLSRDAAARIGDELRATLKQSHVQNPSAWLMATIKQAGGGAAAARRAGGDYGGRAPDRGPPPRHGGMSPHGGPPPPPAFDGAFYPIERDYGLSLPMVDPRVVRSIRGLDDHLQRRIAEDLYRTLKTQRIQNPSGWLLASYQRLAPPRSHRGPDDAPPGRRDDGRRDAPDGRRDAPDGRRDAPPPPDDRRRRDDREPPPPQDDRRAGRSRARPRPRRDRDRKRGRSDSSPRRDKRAAAPAPAPAPAPAAEEADISLATRGPCSTPRRRRRAVEEPAFDGFDARDVIRADGLEVLCVGCGSDRDAR